MRSLGTVQRMRLGSGVAAVILGSLAVVAISQTSAADSGKASTEFSNEVFKLTHSDPTPGTLHYDDVGVRLEPVSDSSKPGPNTPQISGARAKEILESELPMPADSELRAAVEVSLTFYSNDVATAPDERGIQRLMNQNVLAWAVDYPLIHQVVSGGTALHPAYVADSNLTCENIGIVDALTGQWLQTFQTCAAPNVPIPAKK